MKKSVLYYPTINIKNNDWLKNALLYYDNIYSIVPDDYDYDKFTPEIKYLFDENIYVPLDPQILLDDEIYPEFEKELFKQLYIRCEEYDIIKTIEPSFGIMRCRKLKEYIWKFMQENNIVRRYFDKYAVMDVGYIKSITALMAKYIAYLENIKNPNEIIVPSTDKAENFKYGFDGMYFQRKYISTLYKFMPTPFSDTPLERIIDFKNENEMELVNLRKVITDYEKRISCCKDRSDIINILNEFYEEMEYQIKTVDELLKKKKIQYYLTSLQTVMNITVPSVLMSVTDIPVSLKALGVVANGAISLGICCVNSNYNKKDILLNSPVAYLYNACNEGLIDINF